MMEETKKKGKGNIIVTALLLIIILVLVGYICYDKGLILSNKDNKEKSNTIAKKEENKEESKEKSLDINSRLVQELYNRVSYIEDNGSCTYGIFTDDFYVKDGDEEKKMMLVGRQLGREGRKGISPYSEEYAKLEKEIVKVNMHNYLSNSVSSYSKSYVESIYKKLYGENAKLNTSTVIYMDRYNASIYIYVDKLDAYVSYLGEGGGTCGPITYDVKATKATLNNGVLKIYENSKQYISSDTEEINGKIYKKGDLYAEENYIYTFELEDDGLYSFVSRTKA